MCLARWLMTGWSLVLFSRVSSFCVCLFCSFPTSSRRSQDENDENDKKENQRENAQPWFRSMTEGDLWGKKERGTVAFLVFALSRAQKKCRSDFLGRWSWLPFLVFCCASPTTQKLSADQTRVCEGGGGRRRTKTKTKGGNIPGRGYGARCRLTKSASKAKRRSHRTRQPRGGERDLSSLFPFCRFFALFGILSLSGLKPCRYDMALVVLALNQEEGKGSCAR